MDDFAVHRIAELIRKKSKTRAADEAEKAGRHPAMANMQQPTLPNVDDFLEPSLPAVGTPRTPYAQKSPSPYGMQTPKTSYNYIQQQQPPTAHYIHSNHSNHSSSSNSNKHGGPPPPLQNQYGYDYYQAKSPPPGVGMASTSGKPKESFDPYAESAFTSDDVYGGVYNRDQGQPFIAPQSQIQGRDGYSNAGVGSPTTYYSGNSSSKTGSPPYTGQTPPARGRRYNDYIPERSASPIQSQHGSDLDSHHGGSVVGGHNGGAGYGPVSRAQGGGYSPGGYGNARYAGQGVGGGGASYGNNYQPTNPRQQDTAPNSNRNVYRGGGGRPGY